MNDAIEIGTQPTVERPVPLREWFMTNLPGPSLLWGDGLKHQVDIARTLCDMLLDNVQPFVVSTHKSKSVVLPVMLLRGEGLDIYMRCNFYDWKFSIVSREPLDVDLSGLCYTAPLADGTSRELLPCYFEGFPEELVFSYYSSSDKRRWSARVYKTNHVAPFVFLVGRAAGLAGAVRTLTP